MILHSDKKVICVKDIPSNIFEEAIFILKENVADGYEEENEERTKEIILKEAEAIVDEYQNKMQDEDEEEMYEEVEVKSFKGEIIYVVSLLIVLAICISSVM